MASVRGSSFIEILVALVILSVSGVGLALIHKETDQQREHVRWRWQGQQWLDTLAHNLYWQRELFGDVQEGPLCIANASFTPDCTTTLCTEQEANLWQQQRLCTHINHALNHPAVQVRRCDGGRCLIAAPNHTLASQCIEHGEITQACLQRYLLWEVSDVANL